MKPRTLLPLAVIAAWCILLSSCAGPRQAAAVGPAVERQPAPYSGPKAKVAVSTFKDKSGRGYREIGAGMSEMLVTALINTNRFMVLERQDLQDVMDEQDLVTQGRISKETGAPTGEIVGSDLLITGAITAFEPEASGGGGGLLVPGGAVGGSIKKAYLAMDIRVVDAKTSEVVAAISVEGTATTAGGGVIGGPMPAAFGGWSKTPVEKAIRLCLQRAVDDISLRTPARYYRHQ